ncbi:nucleoside deaminase [Saccharopolyspora phatthalungensis]|uniref:Guanine deaminase n=1 Tax=Saccharopolyspora phatthalungensis TaxID=664693 RepID=A0A840Q3D1_9PSEU|nr:nucleoside deaminase [Saccharopolyspora phatthalungensis]MBB5153209.1 guanine deaminase [Saccharopolyspora phatthalungensis]
MSVDVAVGTEQDWMARAIELATSNVDNDGGPFGALIVRDGEIIATGTNKVTADLDPTAHAEVTAIRNACRALDSFKLAGCVLVTSCEPCPMCLAAALWARVDRVLFAADRDDAADAGFDDRAFYDAFEDPETKCPTPVLRVRMPNRNAAFDAWRGKADRVDY